MTIEQAQERLSRIELDKDIQNLIAQANSRYILLNTGERKENFPGYTIKDDKLEILAFYYLNIGCTLAENQNLEKAREPLEKGASILEYIHGSKSNRSKLSNYYGIISSLAYYVCFQYSKSFILIKKFENSTILSKLLFLFLARNYNDLIKEINKIVVDITYNDDFVTEHYEEIDGDAKINELIIAKSLNGFLQYFFTGNEDYLIEARKNLFSLKEISEFKNDPGIWWVLRLLLLITDGFKEAALWQVLKNYFDINDYRVRNYIFSLIFLPPRGVNELFITQRKSLSTVLNTQSNGSVVSIPTSSGKTRIAEIAILNSLTKNNDSKVLYVAPFRSLAFEIENTFDRVFGSSNYITSHLYGGSLFTKLDEKIIEESHIVIATPEKAKAMLRGNSEILNKIKLVIIDEGHLLGPNKRLIVNEIFYEELRFFINRNKGKFLLLSAVLPNAEELAKWLTESNDTVYKDTWRPSDERFGVMEWTGSHVNLRWKSTDIERETFNSRFIEKIQLPLKGRQRKLRFFPSGKNDAVTATAFKLRGFGPALIFVGRKDSVFVMAESYLNCLGNAPEDFSWKHESDWKAFELACKELYGENCNWLLYARKGILCHMSDLHSDVRLPLERLMRNDKPLVIIATSTLGQGVNLGISTVIFSTLSQAGSLISSRDFWNISGRTGRAFIDHEGKVLVALDVSENITYRQKFKIRTMRNAIEHCFDKNQITPVTSGILILLEKLKTFALSQGISFELLIQLISENNIQNIGEGAKYVDDYLDWIDDSLLSLLNINNESIEEIEYGWVAEFFRKSLAYIQAEHSTEITPDEVVKLIKSRIEGIVNKVGVNKNTWESIITSGLPLNSNLIIEERLPFIIDQIEEYQKLENTLENKIELLKSIEGIIKEIPIINSELDELNFEDLNEIRSTWLSGKSLLSLNDNEQAVKIINSYYMYVLPWVVNAIARKLRYKMFDDKAIILEELSILMEVGLPNIQSMKVYQAGIRSRISAFEIGNLFDLFWYDQPIKDFKKELINNKEKYKVMISKSSAEWIELLSSMTKSKELLINLIPPFNLPDGNKPSELLIAREINGKQYLVSPDLTFMEDISVLDINFGSVNNIDGIYFKYNSILKFYEMLIVNPYIKV